MTVNPHMALRPVFFGARLASARVVAILVHGRAQSPADMEAQVVRRIGLPDVAYVAPAAADQTWYPGGFMLPIEQNQPSLTFALERLATLADELAGQGRPLSTQVLIGFSQGACLACEHVHRRRQRLAALIAFTGGLIGPPGSGWSDEIGAGAGVFEEMPVLLGGSDVDPWVPAARMLETAEVFRRLGARVSMQLYPGQGHVIGDEQIAEARALLAALPAPSR